MMFDQKLKSWKSYMQHISGAGTSSSNAAIRKSDSIWTQVWKGWLFICFFRAKKTETQKRQVQKCWGWKSDDFEGSRYWIYGVSSSFS